MAFVNVPKDLSKVKTKVALNLTKRQLLCFGAAAIIGVPTYILTRGAIGNTGAAFLMIGLMMPPFFLAMYEKDGQPAEVILRNYIRARIYWPGIRLYKVENLYQILEKEADKNGNTPNPGIAAKSKKTAATPVSKRPSGKEKPSGSKKTRDKRER